MLVTQDLFDPSRHCMLDGTSYPHAMVVGPETVLAETVTDLVAYLLPGYGSIPAGPDGDDQAFVERASAMICHAAKIQAVIAADGLSDGEFRPEELDEATLTAIFGDRTIPLDLDHWDGPIPLVLLVTDYAPFADRLPPTGNVLWLDPSDELAFLASLANAGVLRHYAHESA